MKILVNIQHMWTCLVFIYINDSFDALVLFEKDNYNAFTGRI